MKTDTAARARHRFDNGKRRRPEAHSRQRMLTPGYVLEPIRTLFGGSIGLDSCTEPDNPTGAKQFYCPPKDGCALPWNAKTVFCNPPYGEVRKRWVERCIEEGGRGRKVVLLIPAHTETGTFQLAAGACDSMLLVRARLMFEAVRKNGRHEAASHGSAIFGYGVTLDPLRALGLVFDQDEGA